MKTPAISTSAKLAFGLTILLAGAFYYLFSKLHDRVEQQYYEAVEETMVDAAHLFAALAEQGVGEDGKIEIDTLRDTFNTAKSRQLNARIYDHLKTAVTMNVYVLDEKGIVLYDSDGGKAEGEDYNMFNDYILTMDGKYGARSTRTDEEDPNSSIMFAGAPIYQDGKVIGVPSSCILDIGRRSSVNQPSATTTFVSRIFSLQ